MRRLRFLALALATVSAACDLTDKDNFQPPETTLEGRIVYGDQLVGVRQNAIELELWQDGYELNRYIPVEIHQDGTFSAKLFEGSYKLVRKQGVGPWVSDPDTIRFELNGPMNLDVPVRPFFAIRGESIQRNGSTLNARFNVEQVVPGREVERAALLIGRTQFVDARYNAGRAEKALSAAELGAPISLSLDVSGVAADRDYVFARVGVKTRGVEEMIYTPVQKIQLR